MVDPQNGGALEITAQIVAGHPWQENDTLLLEVLVLAGPWIRFEVLDRLLFVNSECFWGRGQL